MAKPSFVEIQNGLNGWDATVNDNFIRLFDKPIPIFLHAGDQTDLEAGFPATSHEECLVIVDHTVLGLVPYMVDKNAPGGAAWRLIGELTGKRAPTAVSGVTTLSISDEMVLIDATGAFTITLAPAIDMVGSTIRLKISTGASTIVIDGSGAETIDGVLTFSLLGFPESVTLYCDGSAWHIV
jgi:hypothetical protein